jgi:hypothetical protein
LLPPHTAPALSRLQDLLNQIPRRSTHHASLHHKKDRIFPEFLFLPSLFLLLFAYGIYFIMILVLSKEPINIIFIAPKGVAHAYL